MRAATPARMKDLSRASLHPRGAARPAASLVAARVCLCARHHVRDEDQRRSRNVRVRRAGVRGAAARARATRPRSPAGRQGPRTNPIALQRAARDRERRVAELIGLVVRATLRRTPERGRLPRAAPRGSHPASGHHAARSTSPASTSPSTASRSTPPASARPSFSLARTPEDSSTGSTSPDEERDQTDASAADDDAREVVARFNLTLAGLADVPDGTAANPRVHGVRPPGGKILLRDRVV